MAVYLLSHYVSTLKASKNVGSVVKKEVLLTACFHMCMYLHLMVVPRGQGTLFILRIYEFQKALDVAILQRICQ